MPFLRIATKAEALAKSEAAYDRDCDYKHCPTPKRERVTRYAYGMMVDDKTGAAELYVPPSMIDLLDESDRAKLSDVQTIVPDIDISEFDER